MINLKGDGARILMYHSQDGAMPFSCGLLWRGDISIHSEKEETIAIPLSRITLTAILGGCTVFLCLGLWLLSNAHTLAILEALLAFSFGGADAVISALLLYYFGRMLLDSSPGLLISPEGIVDNTTPMAAGPVPWEEITKITVSQVDSPVDRESFGSLLFLVIHIRHPRRYLERGNALERMVHRWNYGWYGTPVRLSSIALKIKFDELKRIVQENFDKYRRA